MKRISQPCDAKTSNTYEVATIYFSFIAAYACVNMIFDGRHIAVLRLVLNNSGRQRCELALRPFHSGNTSFLVESTNRVFQMKIEKI